MGMSASTFEVHAFQCHVGCLAIGMGCLLASDFSYLIVLAASIFFAVYVGRSMGRGDLNPVRHLSIAGLFWTKSATLRPSRLPFWPLPAFSG